MIRTGQKMILVLRYRFIGDTILTVPFFRNLRRAEPEAHITWVMAPGSADVVQGIPYVDEILFWDPATIHADSRGGHRTLSAKIAFIRELRVKKYDKVYVLKRSFSSALIAFLSGAPERVGFDTEGRGFLLTKKVTYRPEQHEVLSFLDVLRADGIPVLDDYLESWVTPDEAAKADELLRKEGVHPGARLLALHPFGSIYQKTWPMARFAAVARVLQERHGLTPVLLGAPGDRHELEKGEHQFPEGTVDLVGKCNLRISLAVLRKSALFLGNDSGVMHLAASAGLPLLALFGPTSPTRFGPWGRDTKVVYTAFPCSPCRQKYFTECQPAGEGRPECVMSSTVDQVCQACEELLKETEAR
jgi:heptosyltransferase II